MNHHYKNISLSIHDSEIKKILSGVKFLLQETDAFTRLLSLSEILVVFNFSVLIPLICLTFLYLLCLSQQRFKSLNTTSSVLWKTRQPVIITRQGWKKYKLLSKYHYDDKSHENMWHPLPIDINFHCLFVIHHKYKFLCLSLL